MVQRHAGTVLEPVFSRKIRLRLHETLDHKGRLEKVGMKSVERAVAEAVADHPRLHGSQVFAFATSVIRDAPNRDEIIARVARTTGTRLRVLSGAEEARLAYVAARQWAGPTARQLLVLDIGGGTVEIASGIGEQPRAVHSLPLGARRITRDWLPGGIAPSPRRLAEIRQHLSRSLEAVPGLPQLEPGGRVLACSKTFEQLSRLAAGQGRAPRARRQLALPQLNASVSLLAGADPSRRAKLPGISRHRAEQSLAGALIARAVMEACGAKKVEICPWSVREGLLLEHFALPRTAADRRSGW
ncbi:Ppx/GppA phosphatase family protein [Streptomyces sp. NPDC088747]|uniref:Ppx/GppA phosphatase family protein n=1 Tax=Streptomyces sp. NPDC088747 TaxID=3365886 RepID=UPI0037F997A1